LIVRKQLEDLNEKLRTKELEVKEILDKIPFDKNHRNSEEIK
jgi:hypothetical protein